METESGYPGMMSESKHIHIPPEMVRVQFNLIAILKCGNVEMIAINLAKCHVFIVLF